MCGMPSRSYLSTSCFLRHRDARSRSSHSVSVSILLDVFSLLMDIWTVYEGDQEAFSHDRIEILREHRDAETYGSIAASPRRTVRVEQG